MSRTASAVAAGALALAALVATPASADAATQIKYSNCTTYRATSHLKHGVGLTHRRDHVKPGSKSKPVTNFKQVARMSQLMGTPLPQQVLARLEVVAHDPVATRAVGVQIASELAERMLREGAPGLHFITLNRSTATLEVHRNLSL